MKHDRFWIGCAWVGSICVTAAPGFCQNAPQNAQQNSNHQQSEHPAPPHPVNNSAAAQVGAVMQHSGGSLLQAQLAVQADQNQAHLAQVSFFAVPEQQPKTLKKHDLISIIINEASDIQSKGTADLKKDAQLQAQVNQWVKLDLQNRAIYGLPTPSTPAGIDVTGNRTLKGDAEVDRTDVMTAHITAEVLDVKPNGTLVLQARKHIKIDDEEQTFILSGTCLVEDVTADNSVLSSQLHDLELQKNHKGAVKDITQRGIAGKLLDFINPF